MCECVCVWVSRWTVPKPTMKILYHCQYLSTSTTVRRRRLATRDSRECTALIVYNVFKMSAIGICAHLCRLRKKYHPSLTFIVIKCLCIRLKWINCTVNLYSLSLAFHKAVSVAIRDLRWGGSFNVSFLHGFFLSLTVENMTENWSVFAKVIIK